MLYALGAAIAAAAGHAIDWQRYALGQAAVTAFQLMTHYGNEYFDLEADRANATPTRWSGGSRVLVGGELPARVALIAAVAFAIAGAVFAAIVGEYVTCAAIFVLAWEYSAPPLRLCARGLGELTTAAVVTVLVPWLAFSIQSTDGAGARWLALSIVPLALLQFAMLVAIEFPDAEGDARTGKRTLVVRLGARGAARVYAVAVVASFASLPIAWACGLPGKVCAAAACLAPLAVWRVVRVSDHADASAHERMGFYGVALLVATSVAELIAWVA